MKALTLTQPWAWSILRAGKRIENRSRRDGRMPSICRHRGPLLLHAARGMTIRDYEAAVAFMVGRGLAGTKYGHVGLPSIPPRLQDVGDDWLPRGVIVGRCRSIGHIEPGGLVVIDGEPGIRNPVDLDASGVNVDWWMGGYALVLADVEPTKWVPCRGMLGLWTPPEDVLAQLGVSA